MVRRDGEDDVFYQRPGALVECGEGVHPRGQGKGEDVLRVEELAGFFADLLVEA